MTDHKQLTHSEMLELRRWNTPTVYNGWEQITGRNAAKDGFNIEETVDFMPQMGAMEDSAMTTARMAPQAPPIMAGTNSNTVSTSIDFVLAPK